MTITGNFVAINYFLIYTLGFLHILKFWFCKCTTPCMLLPLDILLEHWIEHVSLDSFMSCLHCLLGYSTGEFQAMQLIVLAAFGAMDQHCPLYVGPLFGNLVQNDSRFVSLT